MREHWLAKRAVSCDDGRCAGSITRRPGWLRSFALSAAGGLEFDVWLFQEAVQFGFNVFRLFAVGASLLPCLPYAVPLM